jgi:hypothetical protein
MSNTYEYDGRIGGPACDYADLRKYNSNSVTVPFQGKNVSGVMVVPSWGGMSYDSLGGMGNCGGYGTIQSAYGKDAANCQTTYRTSLCSGKL